MVYPPITHWIEGQPPPLADDAIKWQLAKHLYDDFHGTDFKPDQPICMFHLDSPHSEDLAEKIIGVLRLAGYSVDDSCPRPSGNIPKGITVWSEHYHEVSEHADYIKNRFEGIAHLPVEHTFTDELGIEKPSPLCRDVSQPCLAITIGNPQP
jgi:hypothetical protein